MSIRFNRRSFNKQVNVTLNSNLLESKCATNQYFQIIGSIHDVESYFAIDNVNTLNSHIFLCHWGHLAIIFMWSSRNLYHVGWDGNYELWRQNTIKTVPVAHIIWDPHFELLNITNNIAYSGIYNWLFTLGFISAAHLYNFVMTPELLAVISILLAYIHLIYLDSLLHNIYHFKFCITPNFYYGVELRPHFISLYYKSAYTVYFPFKLFIASFDLGEERLNFHTGIIIGLMSIFWCTHLDYMSIPVSRDSQKAGYEKYITLFYDGKWFLYFGDTSSEYNLFGLAYGAGSASLTFFGGNQSNTISLYITDIAHHHLGVGVLFILSAHLYSSYLKGFGHFQGDILFSNSNSSAIMLALSKSPHFQLSLGCTGLGVLASVTAQHLYSLAAFVYLSYDYATSVALYSHHQYIASFLIMATLVHASIFLVRDYTVVFLDYNAINSVLSIKYRFISHLSWICLFLGFHTFPLYIHNDTVVAFGS